MVEMTNRDVSKTIEVMLKPVYIVFDNGDVFVIDAHCIADNEAKYYAKNHPDDETKTYEENYKYEYDWLMSDDFEIQEWMKDNMNWSDLNALYVGKYKYDYDDHYLNESEICMDVDLSELIPKQNSLYIGKAAYTKLHKNKKESNEFEKEIEKRVKDGTMLKL